MNSKITKFAAAAIILIAVMIGVNQFGGSIDGTTIAFADVVQPLLDAETGSFKMKIDVISSGLDWINCGDEPLQTIDVVFAGPSRTRWDVPTGEVLVANMQYGKVMILMPAKMQAVVMQVSPPGVIQRHNRFNKLLELRRFIQYALETEDESVEFLGEQEINGVKAIGYRVTGHGDITIWADSETILPIQIEQTMGAETAVINDISYDVELDESLFNVEPPEGYLTVAPGEDKQPKFVIKGTVTDSVTGLPIEGVQVSDDGYGPKPYKSTTTDSDGKYHYLTWPEEHRIKAEAAGYKSQHKGITGLFHADNENAKVMDFELERE
jgi:outer membrane lipoprotein-sorting protein